MQAECGLNRSAFSFLLELRLIVGSRLLRPLISTLQSQQNKADDGNQDVRIKDHSGIPGSKVMCGDHLVDVAPCGPQQKHRRPYNRCGPHTEAASERQKAHDGISQAGGSHFKLKRTLRPPDETGCDLAEKRMHDEVVEKRTADGKEQEPGEECLDNGRLRYWSWFSQQGEPGSDQSQNQEAECKIFHYKLNQVTHRSLFVRESRDIHVSLLRHSISTVVIYRSFH